jgi:hypothetical protein
MLPGYRSLIRFQGGSGDYGFELQGEAGCGNDGIAPGSSKAARLSFWAVDELPPLLQGLRFEVREGSRIIGHGEIVDEDR